MNKRKKLLVDAVQTMIIKRLVCYWIAGLMFVTMVLSLLSVIEGPGELFTTHLTKTWIKYWPVFACSFALLPFAMLDFLRVTNRFAGPIYRIRKELKAFETEGEMDEIHLRPQDFWSDLSDGMNNLNSHLRELETKRKGLCESCKARIDSQPPAGSPQSENALKISHESTRVEATTTRQ